MKMTVEIKIAEIIKLINKLGVVSIWNSLNTVTSNKRELVDLDLDSDLGGVTSVWFWFCGSRLEFGL